MCSMSFQPFSNTDFSSTDALVKASKHTCTYTKTLKDTHYKNVLYNYIKNRFDFW